MMASAFHLTLTLHFACHFAVMMSLPVSSKLVGRRSSFCHVLRDWRVVALEDNGGDLTFLDLFKGVEEHRFDETFNMPSEFVVMCEMGQVRNADLQSIPLHVKVWRSSSCFVCEVYLQDAEVCDCRQSYNVKLAT